MSANPIAGTITLYAFWPTTGGAGITGNVTREANSQPDIDLTTVDEARFRVLHPDGTTTFWEADLLASPAPTATTLSVRHTFEADDYDASGPLYLWIEVSADSGATWYPQRVPYLAKVIDQ